METTFNFRQDKLLALECPPGKQKIRFFDTRVAGLALRVRTSGSKSYAYYKRLPDRNESPRKLIEIQIGRIGDISLEQARRKATEFNYLVGEGKDPSLKEVPPIVYGELFAKYIEEYAKLHTVTWQESIKNHKRYFALWDKKPLNNIRRDQVQSWLNNVAASNGKHTANRIFNSFRAVLTWGQGQGIFTGENPCLGVTTFKTRARERFIQPGDEFARFAESLNAEGNTTIRDFFWMSLFTGARCANVLAMEWSQINLDLQQWRIPVTKNDDSQIVPLTIAALEILRRRQNEPDAHNRWVFPSDRKGWKTGALTHLVSPRKAFMRITERAGIEDLRIHDLRRTAGSYMAMQNVSLTIIGKALGHRSPQATSIYARLTQDPVRQALENSQAALSDPSKLLPIEGRSLKKMEKKKKKK